LPPPPVQPQPLPVTIAPTPPAPASGARIAFANPNFDFGKIQANEVVRHDFIFTNVGTTRLELTDVRPSCGCTTAGTWDRSVEPGQRGKIPLQFNSAGFSGTVSKSATVTCNDPTQPTVILSLRATVWKAIDVNPAYAYFFVTEANLANESRVIRITNNQEEDLKLSDLQCTNSAFKAELKTIKPGKEFEVHIRLAPPLSAPTTQGQITLKTSSTNLPLISINSIVTVQPSISVMPQQLYLPTGPVQSNNLYSITIRNNGATNIALSDPTVNVEGASVKLQENQPGKVFTVQVSFPPGYQLPAGRPVELAVRSTHPQQPLIKVPVLQFPAPAPAPVYRPPTVTPPAAPSSATVSPTLIQPGLRTVPTRPAPAPQ
jgi:hypothetical protein